MSFFEKLPWILIQKFVNLIVYAKRLPWLTSIDQPNRIKTYPGKEYLFASRIFRPANTNGPLPLVIRVHGGGFMMNNPAGEDATSRFLADRAKCVVITPDYRKTPINPFPAAYDDLIDATLSAIEDKSLDIDPSKVILCGTSAGGNLSLAIAQDARLKGKLLGILAVAPVADLAIPAQDKINSRPDPSVPDFLAASYDRMLRFYLGGQNIPLTDTRLSPARFQSRQDLPKHMYVLSIEHDMLSREASSMAEKLAKGLKKQGDEDGWEAGTVRWSLIRGQKHAFEAFPEKDKDAEAARLIAIDYMRQSMASWLKSVFEAN